MASGGIRGTRWAAQVGLVVGLCSTCEAVAAPASTDHIAWSAPAECPDRSAFLGAIEALSIGARTPVTGGVAILRESGRWRAVFALQTGAGHLIEGELRAQECALLTDVLAVKVALSAAPQADARPITSGVSSDAEQPPLQRRLPPVVRAVDVPRHTRPRGTWFLRGSLNMQLGFVDAPMAMPGIALIVRGRAWQSEFDFAQSVPILVARSTHVARTTLSAWTLRGCWTPRTRRMVWGACAVVAAGMVRARGVALPTMRTAYEPWVAAGIAASVRPAWRSWVVPYFGVEPTVTVLRPAVKVDGLGVLWRAGGVGARFMAGVELALMNPRKSGHP